MRESFLRLIWEVDMKKLLLILVEIVLLVVMVVVVENAINNPPRQVTVALSEFKVMMDRQVLPANVPITYTFVNSGSVVHEVVLEKNGAVDEPYELNGEELEAEDIQMGEKRAVTWDVNDAGDYQLACHKPGHFEGGMTQTFKLVPVGSLLLVPLTTWLIVGIGAFLFVGLAFYGLRGQRTARAPAL
jgi:uncharacterized cupredoxin-like copper-binding protein